VAEQGDTLGAQLRRRRRERGHRRIDAARLIGIDPKSLLWWERDARKPLDPSWPSIIAYLGREPWRRPETLAERLLAERRRRGLSISEAAAIAGVEETTFWWWESGRRLPRYPRTKSLVAGFLGDGRS
jgi:transcriptional regulator with XRE-family HTH domain